MENNTNYVVNLLQPMSDGKIDWTIVILITRSTDLYKYMCTRSLMYTYIQHPDPTRLQIWWSGPVLLQGHESLMYILAHRQLVRSNSAAEKERINHHKSREIHVKYRCQTDRILEPVAHSSSWPEKGRSGWWRWKATWIYPSQLSIEKIYTL